MPRTRGIAPASRTRAASRCAFVFTIFPNDFVQGLLKPLVFGGLIAITACYFGLRTTGGTEGVGQSTTKTVVTSSILILVSDYFLTQILLAVLVVP